MKCIKDRAIWLADLLDACSRFIGRQTDLILFWVSLFPVLPIDIKNGHFLRERRIEKKTIPFAKIDIAKTAISQMESEYQERKKASAEKVKILFQILTLVFTVISATLAYIIKELKININPIFALSLLFSCVSLFMVLTYYRVSTINVISFPTFQSGDDSEEDYLSDRLRCIEMNNARLDYVVTVYKSALRYFYVALMLLFTALFIQFRVYFSWG